MTVKLGAFLAGTVLLLGISAAGAMEPGFPRGEKLFQRIDKDKNGELSLEELKPGLDKRFTRVDVDGDGKVTSAEIDQWLSKQAERRKARIIARMDTDKDGTVSIEELDGLIEILFTAADTDKDGGVSLEEARKFRFAKRAKPGQDTQAN